MSNSFIMSSISANHVFQNNKIIIKNIVSVQFGPNFVAATRDNDFIIKVSRKKTSNQTFQCKGCACFKDKVRFKNHILGIHKYKFFNCIYCSKLVPFDGFEDHISRCELIKAYQEPNFNSLYEAQYQFILSHTSMGYYITVNILPPKEKVEHVCDICDSLFSQIPHMEGHIFYIHGFVESITCTICKKDDKISNIQQHLLCQKSSDLRILFKLKKVEFFFSLSSSGNNPTLVVEAMDNEIAIRLPLCEICNETFNSFQLFSKHVADHHNTDRFKCLSCLRISTFSSLEDHVIAKHRSSANRELKFELIFNSESKKLVVAETKIGLSFSFARIGKSQCRDIFGVTITKRNDNWTCCRCVICKLDFRHIYQLYDHVSSVHDSFKFYTCTSCLTVRRLPSLRLHVCENSDGKTVKFRSGKRQYSIIKLDTDQLYVKIQERNVSQCDNFCLVCKHKTDDEDRESLKIHLKYKHKMTFFLCNHCLEPVRFEKFDEHILLKHNALNQVVCSLMQCFESPPGPQFTNYSLIIFEGLRLVVKNDQEIAYDCTLCKCKSENRSSFQKHLATTHGIYFFKCIQCNSTMSFFGLEEHIASQHINNANSTLFLCVTPGGLKINSYLEQRICFTDEYIDPKVFIKFIETSHSRNGKFLSHIVAFSSEFSFFKTFFLCHSVRTAPFIEIYSM